MRRYAIVFALVMGIGMLGMWAMFFLAGDVPELETAPVSLGFHLAAEALTALLLIAAGLALALRRSRAVALYRIAAGMLLYTVVMSPGYFAQQGEWPFVAMFAAFATGALVALWAVAGLPEG